MDLFNKKKIKELEHKNKILKEDFDELEIKLQDINCELLLEQRCSKAFERQNDKLTKWIEGIIKILGTVEVRDVGQIHIPIVKFERNYGNSNPEMFKEEMVENIVIPEIRFSKSVFY